MKVSHFKVLIIMCAILLPLMSCTEKEDKTNNGNNENNSMEVSQNNLSNEENDNKDNHSIEVYMKNLSQKEYVKWVVKSHDGGLGSNGEQLTLPEITNFDYPYVEGIEDIELKNKINQTIKDAIFNVDFFSEPMRGVGISTPPYSEYEFPGIILFNDILSIPITLYYDYEKDIYKSISVTIDLKTGKRLYLEDIIKLNERLAKNILYEDDFFIDIKGVIMMKEYLDNYCDANEVAQSEASKQLLDTLRNYMPKDEKPKTEEFYLTKDGLVLTKFANNSPMEINIPIKNLKDFLKIKSWEHNSVLLQKQRTQSTETSSVTPNASSKVPNTDKIEYIIAYSKFLLNSDNYKDDDGFPVFGFYLIDMNFDKIPELAVLHESGGLWEGIFNIFDLTGHKLFRF